MFNPILKRNSKFTDQVIRKLKTLLTQPEVPLVEYGDEAENIYFVMNGICVVSLPDDQD